MMEPFLAHVSKFLFQPFFLQCMATSLAIAVPLLSSFQNAALKAAQHGQRLVVVKLLTHSPLQLLPFGLLPCATSSLARRKLLLFFQESAQHLLPSFPESSPCSPSGGRGAGEGVKTPPS